MSKEYQDFRVKTLETLDREFPSGTYRQKMKMVAEKWKQYKITSLTPLSQEEIINDILLTSPTDETVKKLKHTIESMTESEFAKLTHEGDPLLLTIIENLFNITNNGDRKVHMLIHKYINRDEMYNMRTKEGLDILDLCILYSRHDVIYKILLDAPILWLHENVYNSKNQSRTSCLYGLLFINFDYIEHRQTVIDILRNSIKDGLNPNLEIGDCIIGKDVRDVYKEGDDVFNYLLKTKVPHSVYSKFINYVGISDVGKPYRERMFKIMRTRKPSYINRKQPTDVIRYVGETIFSVYLDKANNYRHRNYCESLFEMNVVDLKTVFVRNGRSTSCYQNLLFEKNVKTIANVGCMVMTRTPAYFFFVPSAMRPLEVFIRSISTSWEFFIYSKTSIMVLVESMFKKFLVPPDTSILRKLVLHPKFSSHILDLYTKVGSNVSEYILNTNPEKEIINTVLAKLILRPYCIDKIMTEIKAGNVSDWKRGFTKDYFKQIVTRHYQEAIVDEFDKRVVKNPPMNDWFLLSDEETGTYSRDGNLVFVTGDNYLFRVDELAFILEKSQNPFNRKEFTMDEVLEIQKMLNVYYEWWFVYPITPVISGPVPRLDYNIDNLNPDELEIIRLGATNDLLIGLIDDYLEASPLFYYGEKLRTHVDKLHPPEKILNAYLILLNNPSVLIGENDIGLLTSCIGFQRDNYDHSSIEEINIYYGLKFAQFSNDKNTTSDLLRKRILNSLLSWIYLILDSTDYHSNNDRLNGRLISLYFLILNFIK